MVSITSFSLKGAGWYGDGYGTKAESGKSENDTSEGTAVAAEETASDITPANTPIPTSSQTSSTTQAETKGTADDTPSPSLEKADAKPTTSEVV
jgi:hypothetical protein